MTLIGKLLAFLNLVAGLGILSWSVSTFVLRPFTLAPAPESISKGQQPENIKQMQAEQELLAATAGAASANWGTQRKILEELEVKREERLKQYAVRLGWHHKGNEKDNGNAFYEPMYDADGLLDLANKGAPIKGIDNLPLKGADTLMNNFLNDVAAVKKFEEDIVKRRKEFSQLLQTIKRTNERLRGITDIRETVQSELFFLSSFEVNVYETRETVLRRKKQLVGRLDELGIKPKVPKD